MVKFANARGWNLASLAGALGSTFGLSLIVAFVLYARENKSGHTGIQPYSAMGVFIPLVFLGGFLLATSGANNRSRKWGIASLVIGFIGIALLVYLDKGHILQPYGEWAKWNG